MMELRFQHGWEEVEEVISITETELDLDNFIKTGKWYFSSTVTPQNIPAGVNGWLEVLEGAGGSAKQIWYRHGTINSNDYHIYVRTHTASGWSNWKRIITEDDFFYKPGDTFAIANLACLGHLTSSQKQIVFNIVTDKRLDNVSDITIKVMTVNARHSDGGYVLQNINLAGSNVSASKATNNTIRVVYNTSSAFTNNCPMSIDISNATITFN